MTFMIAAAPSASANSSLGDDTTGPTWTQSRTYHYKVVNKALINDDYIDKSRRISSCTVLTTGGTCNISSGATATRTVQLAMGADWKNISSQLSFSSSKSQTVTVGCTSPKLKKGQRWVAWAKGDRYKYKIYKSFTQTGPDGGTYPVGTSNWLNAFNPSATGIACGLG